MESLLGRSLTPHDARMKSPLSLAYIGDTVWDLLVRQRLLRTGCHAGALHRMAIERVNAGAQRAAFERITPWLCEDELDVASRGENAHAKHPAPKNQDPVDYSKATGLEALFGYLYLTGQNERITALFLKAFPEADEP